MHSTARSLSQIFIAIIICGACFGQMSKANQNAQSNLEMFYKAIKFGGKGMFRIMRKLSRKTRKRLTSYSWKMCDSDINCKDPAENYLKRD